MESSAAPVPLSRASLQSQASKSGDDVARIDITSRQ